MQQPNNDVQAVANELLSMPPESFAETMLTMFFLKVLHPKGVREMTVVCGERVISLGDGNPKLRLEDALRVLEREMK